MSNQISEAALPSKQPARLFEDAGRHLNGNGDQTLQLVLLRRQIAELERRVEQLTASERQTRNDLLAALAGSQAATREQARLHEELAARERTVSDIVTSEARLRLEIAESRARLRSIESELAGARAQASKLSAEDLAQASAERARLAAHVAERAQLLGFLAEQIRSERRRLVSMRSALDDGVKRTSERDGEAIKAVFSARRAYAAAEQRMRAERLHAWQSTTGALTGTPKRRNRPAKLLEKILCRLGPLGVATALARSGLWNTAFRADTRPSLQRAGLMSYASARPDSDAPLSALFDQRYYLSSNPAVAGSRLAPLAHYLLYGDAEGRSPHPLVDVRYYREANRHELGSTGLTVLQHFLFVGASEGRNPHPLFDVRYYVGQLSDPQDLMVNPLVHYLRTGWRRGLNPHPLFDNDSYLQRYPDAAESMMPPLVHYVTVGVREGHDPHPLFLGRWYEEAYPDVVASGQNPLAHFSERGLRERRNPSAFFDSDHYVEQAPETYSKGVNPLQHYLESGAFEGLSPNKEFDCLAFASENLEAVANKRTPFQAWLEAGCPKPGRLAASSLAADTSLRPVLQQLFDASFYRVQAQDVMDPVEDPLDHYLTAGWRLGLNPHPLFDTAWYVSRYPDVLEAGLAPLLHFAMTGADELCDPHPMFDSRWYAERYPDVSASHEIPLVHYLYFGAREGRSPSPMFDAQAYLAAYPDVQGQDPLVHFLTRWPLDNRPASFSSQAASSPHGGDSAEWIAGLADALWKSTGPDKA